MKVSKKLLSVLLAVVMIMSSMSVCFGVFAAGGTATDAQWNALLAALSNDSVKNAVFSTTADGKYTVDDPDGSVLAAVEAYWAVFSTLANKSPATGNPNNTSNSTGSSEGNRTINQVNTSIKNHIADMAGYEAYMGTFVGNLIGTANVSAGTGSTQTKGGANDDSNDKTVPGTNLSKINDISLTVVSGSAVTGYTLAELPDSVVTEKTFTVSHANDRYDYTYATGTYTTGSGCGAVEHTSYTRTYKYFYYISAVSSADGSAISTQVIKDTAATLEANSAYFSYTLDQFVEAGFEDVSAITAVKDTVVAAKAAVVNAFSGSVYNHFFSAYNVDALKATIETAEDIIEAADIALDLVTLVEAGYDSIITDKGALEALAQDVATKAGKYDGYAADVKAYVESHEYEGKTFNRAAVTDFYNAILREIELIELRALKAIIEATLPTFLGYNEDNVADRTVSGSELNIAKGTVEGWMSALDTYADANVAYVWEGEDIDGYLAGISENLEYLITVNGYTDEFANRYAYYVSTVYANTNVADDSEELSAYIQSYDSWYTGLKALIAEIETELGETVADKIFTELDTAMKAHLDSKYNVLHARIFAQIDLADQLYKVLAADGKITILNIDTYAEFEDALGHVDVDLYNFLLNSENFDMPQLTIDEFNEIWTLALEDYHNFLTSGGFDRYEQTEIADIVRPETEADGHGAHIGDYTVTDAAVEEIIDLIDGLLNDEDIKALLGGLINEDGAPLDLAALLGGLIDGLFTDDLLNTIMGFLYPAVTKEFAKVWAGLPESITVEDVDTGLMGIKADVTANLNLYTVEKATHAIGMSIFPIELAEKLRAEFPAYEAVAAVLDDVTTASAYQLNGDGDADDTYNGDPWKDTALYTTVLDEEGNPVLNDDGTVKTALNFNWGIDEAENKREAFIDAAVAALSGLEPLLLALLSNQYYESTNKIGTGSGSASVSFINLSLNVDPIDLVFMVSNNPGYNNVLGPVFELLGIEAPDGNTLTSTRKVLEDGLFGPIDALLAKIAANPVDTVLSILPNAMYAISAGRILPLLDMLKINIEYTTNATYKVNAYITTIDGSMNDVYKSEEPIKINVKDMINLEDMGLDLSFPGIWDMIMGMLPEGVNLPKLDAGYLATLGKLTWKDTKRTEWTYTPVEAGKAAYIEANKADVLIYLVRYLLNALGENPDLLSALGLELSDDVKAIIAGVTADPDKTIAAIVELFNAVEYDTLKEYVWYVSEVTEGTVEGLTPAIQQYLGYDNDWTKAKAEFILDNIDAIITAVMAMVNGEDAEPFDLTATLTDLIGSLFTNKNITALAKLLAKLDINALVNEGKTEEEALAIDINALVAKFADIDLSGFAAYAELADDYNWGFEDGDRAGFAAALVNILAPLNPVIDFILAGADLALLDGDVTLVGYNGYDSAIVPLVEALGGTPAVLGDQSGLEAVINALLATVDTVLADPIDGILNLIPGLLYFVKSNGLTTAVRNLLQPVYVILETIDPIYALDLNELIGGLTADLGFNLDLGNLGFEAIFDILSSVVALDLSELEEIIDDVCEVIVGEDYASASSIIGANGKKGAYGEFFDEADLITVLVSFALSWVQEGNNANDLIALIAGDDAEKAAEIAKYINGAIAIIGGIEADYESIDWAYNFPEDFDEAIFESGIQIQPTLEMLKYPTNWTEETAKYVVENIDTIVADVLAATGSEYTSLADLLKANVSIYTTENVDAIVKAVADLLAGIDETLLNTVGLVLGADLNALKAYKAPEGIDTAEEFVAALTEVLATIEKPLNWLLFGDAYNFFSKSGADLVTINGAEGYAYGLAPILEALGVETPAMEEATVESVLTAVFARVDAILADPVNEILDVLPNIIYFLNANGVSTSVRNLLAGVIAITDTVKAEFGLEVDLMGIISNAVNGLLPEDTTVVLDVADLDLEAIFALVQELIGLDLTPIAAILVDFCVGQIVAYTSASGEYGFKMMYTDEFARYDMVTILATVLLQTIRVEENEAALKELLGEEIYSAVVSVISIKENVPVQEFDWLYEDKADTDFVFSALETSELYGSGQYGPLYTEEMAQYIADNFGEFVDNIVYLLGISINGENVDNLKDLINGLVNGNLYNSANVIAIRDALAGLAGTLETELPAGAHIKAVLKNSGIADLDAIAAVEVPEFTEDRAQFETYLCAVLEPLYPALNWLLADEDFTFFVDEDRNNIITLPGAEGYAYGIIPLLEVLGCENILAKDAYYDAVEADANVVITSILDPLFDRIDVIMANPADEILDMLPAIIYFINSNGIDTVVKNTLNAVYTLLNAIEPIAKIDLYELIGLDLATLDFEKLFDMLLDLIADATGYEFTTVDASAIAELTIGKVVSYTSANGETAYTMQYEKTEHSQPEMVTVIARLVITFIMHENNQEALLGLLRDNLGMSADAEKYLGGVLGAFAVVATETTLGMDQALATLYYIFYGADLGIGEVTGGLKDINAQWQQILKDLGMSDDPDESSVGNLIAGILDMDIFEDLLSPEGIAPNGFLAFFQKIISLFQQFIEWLKNLFA